jgi:predicted acetyltransferase
MAEIKIRRLLGDEFSDTLYSLAPYSFDPSPPLTSREEWMRRVSMLLESTCLALFENDNPVVCIQSASMTQNVRGEIFPMAAFWGLSALPEVRRKGYARRAFTALMEATREEGHVFSTLYPFRESFYERLGYATFPSPVLARFSPDALAPVLKFDLPGEVRRVAMEEGVEDYRRFMKRKLGRQHGMAFYDKVDAIKEKLREQWVAQAWIDGQMQGIMTYQLQGGEDDQGKFQFAVSRLDYETAEAKYLLLRWIALHIDQADRVLILLPPGVHPETWLSDTKIKIELHEAPMARVLDIQGLNGLPAGDGKFSVLIHDPACPWNEGGWRIEGRNGRLHVVRDELATEGLSIQGLTALIYGSHDPRDFFSRGWGQLSSRSLQEASRMFPLADPFLDEVF